MSETSRFAETSGVRTCEFEQSRGLLAFVMENRVNLFKWPNILEPVQSIEVAKVTRLSFSQKGDLLAVVIE